MIGFCNWSFKNRDRSTKDIVSASDLRCPILGVELISRIASICEELFRLRVQGSSFRPVVEPVKAVGFCQENLWIG